MKNKTTLTARILLIIYIIAVCMMCFTDLSDAPQIDMPNFIFGIPMDKVAHFMMFLPYPVLMYFAFRKSNGKTLSLLLFMIIALVSGLLIAGATELVQDRLEYRSCDPTDFRADSLGLLLGSVSAMIIWYISKRR